MSKGALIGGFNSVADCKPHDESSIEAGPLSCAGFVFRSRPPALRDGSGARRAFVPAAGAPVAKRPAAHEAIGLPGVRDHWVGPAGAGARQALGASVPPHLTIIYLAQRPWQGISSPSGGKVPSGSHQAAPRRSLCCWTWWSSPWGPGSLPGGGGF